ncbi:MAG: cytochrome c maturation protein CcmE [Saprospiraceae bacterium]
MKKIHWVGLTLIIVAIGILISASRDMSTYSNFKEAEKSSFKVKVVGQLSKDKELVYEPQKDPNYFSFFMKDAEGVERKVILHAAKPQDFELSEQLVLTGQMSGSDFVASDMLMKCPSKYKDEEIYVQSKKGT